MKLSLKNVSLLLLATVAVAAAAADMLQGEILGLKWGTEISALKNLEKLWHTESASFFVRPGVKHTIYDIPIPGVVYGFFLDRFFAAYAKVDDPAVFNRLKSELTNRYGEPKVTQNIKVEQQVLTWRSGKIKIKLKHYRRDGKMKLAFYYMPLSEVVNEAQQEELQEKTWTIFPIDKGRAPENLKPEDLPSIPVLRF